MNTLTSLFHLKKFTIAKVATAIGITLTLSSCLKNNDSNYVAPSVAALSIFHASPGTPKVNVAIGNTIINDGYQLIDLEYSKALSYVRVTPGSRKIAILKKNSNDTLRTGTFNLTNNKYYSLFITDIPANLNLVMVEDTIVTPPSGKARVRFVNLSPDAGNLDLIVNSAGTDSTLFTNKAFKTASNFTNLSGTKAYKFEIKSGGTSKAVLDNVEIQSGRIYTIWAKGLSTATNDSLKTSIKVNQH